MHSLGPQLNIFISKKLLRIIIIKIQKQREMGSGLVSNYVCLLLLLWLTQAVLASERKIVSGDCQETCGNNVSIPYPFGIGKGCYFPNSWFEVTCNKSKPILKRLNLELLYSYSDSIVVNNPVIYFNCGGNNNNGKSEVNNVTAAGAFTDILADSPFSFSSANSFGSAGYGGNLATIFSNQIPISGCLQPGFGNGNYCYIGDTPANLAYLGAKMTQFIFPGAKESNRCSSAFIFDQSTVYYSDVLPRVSIDIETRHVPARLDWNTTGLICDLRDCKEPGAPDRVVCNESRCGDVVIEFPFGTKAGCYMTKWFKVTCNKTGQKEKAFLDKINLEVLNTSFSQGTVLVNHPKTYSKCHEHSLGGFFSVNLTDSPFFFSSANNYFAYLGCGSLATFFDNRTVPIGGCLKANCSNIGTSSSSSLVNPCYELAIPPNMGSFAANMTQIYPTNGNVGSNITYCPSAFIIDYRYTDEISVSDYNILKGMNVPSTLQFGMQKSGICELKEGSDTNCSHDGKYCWSKLNPMHFCVCTYDYNDPYNGYTMSGYSIDVCKEAGKCKNRKYKMCNMLCVNEPGNYCSPTSCPNGYVYDSTRKECKPKDISSKESAILIGCSTSLGTLFLLLVTWCLYKVVKGRKKIKRKQRYFKKNGGLLLQQQLSSNDGGGNKVEIIRFFTSKELEKATDRYNENRILGRGGQGTVYKGMLADGRIVAIKKSKRIAADDKKKKKIINQSLDDQKHVEQWVNEVMILSQINHRNVVKLLGCCLETQFPLLVYEFIPNGTLFQMIHENTEEFPLTWRMRLQIAIDVANALSYLHSAASVPIYHRDIKSTNILLDDKYRGKVSDFGISKSIALEQTHLTTKVQGTFGYLDPEYFRSNQFTEKSDVYSFGVVLVELLSGQKPFSFAESGEEVRSLVPVFLLSIKESSLFDSILDRRVMNDGPNEEIIAVAKLAKRCLNLNGKKRPTMKQVAMELEWIRAPGGGDISIPQISDVEEDSEDDEIEPWSNTASSSTTLISKQ